MQGFNFPVFHYLWIFIIDDLSKLVLLRMWPVDHLHLIPEGVLKICMWKPHCRLKCYDLRVYCCTSTLPVIWVWGLVLLACPVLSESRHGVRKSGCGELGILRMPRPLRVFAIGYKIWERS